VLTTRELIVPKLRVLIVDDSTVARRLLSDALSQEPDLEVVTAASGAIALAKLSQVNPDAVTLDVEMPDLNGVETLKRLRKAYPKMPVIMFSATTIKGAAATLDALAAGANDYVTKPTGTSGPQEAAAHIRRELAPRIRALCSRASVAAPVVSVLPPAPKRIVPPAIIAIGVSTGGPNALSAVIPALPPAFPLPIVIVQHMPPVFTRLLGDRLGAESALRVQEAEPGMRVLPFNVYIAPGGFHMTVERSAAGLVIGTNTQPHENSCRPAVDVLFRSVAREYGAATLAVVLTGMGSDGLRGCEHVRAAGGRVVVQDEASSVVWGMPGFVARAGLADKVLPLNEVPQELMRQAAMRPSAMAG